MKYLPSLNALRAFESVARNMSFTQAAREMCVTQGSVSRHIQNLENELNVKLFNRIPRKLSLTQEGKRLYQPLHNALEQISEAANQFSNTRSILKIIVPPTFATRWLIPRMFRFQHKESDLEIQITTSMKEVDFYHYNDFDAAITTKQSSNHSELVCDHLFNEALFPVCSPDFITSSAPLETPADLINYCILHSLSDKREWRAWFEMMGMKKPQMMREQIFELEESSIQAAISGFGVSLVNIHFIQNELALKSLIMVFPDIPPLTLLSYQLTYHRSKSSYLPLQKFRKWLLAEKPTELIVHT